MDGISKLRYQHGYSLLIPRRSESQWTVPAYFGLPGPIYGPVCIGLHFQMVCRFCKHFESFAVIRWRVAAKTESLFIKKMSQMVLKNRLQRMTVMEVVIYIHIHY